MIENLPRGVRRTPERDDGEMLEVLKQLNGETIHLPRRLRDHDRGCLGAIETAGTTASVADMIPRQ